MIFLGTLIVFSLVMIHRVLHRIHEDLNRIVRWYCEDQK